MVRASGVGVHYRGPGDGHHGHVSARLHGVDPGRFHLGRSRQRRGEQGLPRRQSGQQGPGPEGVELGEHVVEEEYRRGPQTFGGQLVGGQLQGQGQGALLALGGLGPARQLPDQEEQLVPVGTHRRDATLDVPGPGLGQGIDEGSRPRSLVLEAHLSWASRPGGRSGRRRWAPGRRRAIRGPPPAWSRPHRDGSPIHPAWQPLRPRVAVRLSVAGPNVGGGSCPRPPPSGPPSGRPPPVSGPESAAARPVPLGPHRCPPARTSWSGGPRAGRSDDGRSVG